MKKIKALLLISLSYLSINVYAQPCDSVQSIQWLVGDWVAEGRESTVVESWKEVSPITFEGLNESRSKISNELKASESLRLVEMSGEIFYLAKVKHNERPIAFKLSECSGRMAIFENPAHDFPQKLEYLLSIGNKLTVTVSGEKGKGFKINFVRRDDDNGL